MKELQVVLPTGLSDEERHLKEMHEKLKEFRRKLAERKNGLLGIDGSKAEKERNKRTIEKAAVATEELKKKIQSGVITVKKVNEKNTFKRARLPDRKLDRLRSNSQGEDGEIVEPGSLMDTMSSPPTSAPIRDSKDSPWNSAGRSDSGWRMRPNMETTSRGPTVYVRGFDLQSDSLSQALEKFGRLVRVNVDERQKSAFVQFGTELEAENAIKEMDGNMLNGNTVRVSFAHRQSSMPGERGRGREREREPKGETRRRDDRMSTGSMDPSSPMISPGSVQSSGSALTDEPETKRKPMRYDDDLFD